MTHLRECRHERGPLVKQVPVVDDIVRRVVDARVEDVHCRRRRKMRPVDGWVRVGFGWAGSRWVALIARGGDLESETRCRER